MTFCFIIFFIFKKKILHLLFHHAKVGSLDGKQNFLYMSNYKTIVTETL